MKNLLTSKKLVTCVVAAAAIGAAAVGFSSTAEAHWYGPGWGPGPFVVGAAAGIATGAAVAAAANAPYYYGGPYPYGYYGPACPRVWNGYYWVRACY